MTNSTTTRAGARTRLVATVRTLVTPRLVVAASVVLVLAGVVAVLSDHVRIGIVAVLLLQGCVVVLAVGQHHALARVRNDLAERIDQASARQLADLARTRHALMTSPTDVAPEEPR